MDYEVYKKVAMEYVLEKYGSLDVLKSYNKPLEDILVEYMYPIVQQECGGDVHDVMKLNRNYLKDFLNEYKD